MSKYVTKKIRCKCCGKEYEANILTGLYQEQVPDLDTNPHHPAIYDRVVMCPKCGYSTVNYGANVEEVVKNIVFSSSYQEVFKDNTIDNVYKKLILAAKISDAKKDYKEAGYIFLLASWYLADKKKDRASVLECVIENYSKYLEKNADIHAAIILIDCLRRCQRFDEAEEAGESLLLHVKEERLEKIIRFELKLIAKGDSKTHSLSEV